MLALLCCRSSFLTTLLLMSNRHTIFGKALSIMSSSSRNNNNSSKTKEAAIIFLHGLGDSPAGWSSLAQTLPRLQPRLARVEYVFPPAPTIPISINGGASMPGWFDLYDWPIAVGAKPDTTGQARGTAQVESCIQDVERIHGIPRSKIVVGGFSQGGAVALWNAYHNHDHGVNPRNSESVNSRPAQPPLAGCAVLSGWWTLGNDSTIKTSGSPSKSVVNERTPLFWAHGEYDDKVLFEHHTHGVQTLKDAGLVSIEAPTYPIGHESDPNEIEALAEFLDRVLFGDKAVSSEL